MPTATYAQVEPAATYAPVEIVAFQHNGRLVAANLEAGSTATVEWASSLAGPWTNTWESLGEVKVGADGLLDVSVPMFFRVRGVGATTLPATTTSTPSTSSSTETVPVIPPSDDYLEIDPSTGPSTSSTTPSTSSSTETAPVAPSSGDYLVIDLSAGPSASSYPVTYLTAVPAGGWTDEYKTTKLVVQRIPAGSFTMGSPSGEPGHRLGGDETQHQVTLTRDFYIGVFEVTQQQWERVMGTWPSSYTHVAYRDSRPVERVSYDSVRGSSAVADWPANGNVDADSFMGRLRARTGKAFDLPTESQWEYAGRAGTTTALNSGYNLINTTSDARLSQVGRFLYNGGIDGTPNGDSTVGTAQVGSYLPNAWGLYDFHGNVWEWCLDWFGTYPGTVSDPKGPVSGINRVARGGAWDCAAHICRIGSRGLCRPDYGCLGFRACLPQ